MQKMHNFYFIIILIAKNPLKLISNMSNNMYKCTYLNRPFLFYFTEKVLVGQTNFIKGFKSLFTTYTYKMNLPMEHLPRKLSCCSNTSNTGKFRSHCSQDEYDN